MGFLSKIFGFNKNPKHRNINFEINELLSIHYPFSFDEIRRVRRYTKSWDDTIACLNFSLEFGYYEPYHAIGLFFDSDEGREFKKRWVEKNKKEYFNLWYENSL